MLDDNAIARLKELEAKATDAPWTPSDEATSHFEVTSATNTQFWVAACYDQRNTDFIAALRNAAHDLIHAAEWHGRLVEIARYLRDWGEHPEQHEDLDTYAATVVRDVLAQLDAEAK